MGITKTYLARFFYHNLCPRCDTCGVISPTGTIDLTEEMFSLFIKDKCYSIGSHCRIGLMNAELSLCQYVIIGAYSYIGGGNHSIADLNRPMVLQKFVSKGGVIIEDDVWIGAHVVVLDGVKIGKGSVIGAHSLVLKDIPDYSIAFGVPAKLHGKRTNENSS